MQIFINNFSSTITASLGPSDTEITLPSEAATALADAADYFNGGKYVLLTLESPTQREVVRVTGESVIASTFIVERAFEGPGELSWPAESKIEARLTASTMETMGLKPLATLRGGQDLNFPWWPKVVEPGMTIHSVTAALKRSDPDASHGVMLWANGAPMFLNNLTIEAGDMSNNDAGNTPVLVSKTVPPGTVLMVTDYREGGFPAIDAEAESVEIELIGSVNPFATFPAPTPDNSEAYLAWLFQEEDTSVGAADSSGNARGGTFVQELGFVKLFLPGPPLAGQAIRFQGNEEVYCAANGLSLPSGNGAAVTIELLVRPQPNKPEGAFSDVELALLHDGNGVTSDSYVRVRFDGEFTAVVQMPSADPVSVQAGCPLSPDHYTLLHVEVILPSDDPTDDGMVTIYVDGELGVGSVSNEETLPSADGAPDTYTGFVVGSLGGPFSGSSDSIYHPHIASAAVFAKALTAGEREDRMAALGIIYPIGGGGGGGGGEEPPPIA